MLLQRSAVISVLLWMPFAWAWGQGAAELDSTQDHEAPERVEEITVTGTRSDVTNIQSESQAITAFSMEALDRAEIVNVDKLAFNVPALHVGQVGSESIITLRGVGSENASITGEPSLQFHVDGVNYVRPSAARVAFFDLEGVQVERGPVGFDGGRNATAGALRVYTRKPHGEYETNADFQWGTYNQRRFRGALNIPLSEYVQTRFAVYREDRDGYQENFAEFINVGRDVFVRTRDKHNAFDADDFGWRGHLRLLPSPGLEALLTFNYFEQKGVGPATEFQVIPSYAACNSPAPFGPGTVISRQPAFAACSGRVEPVGEDFPPFGNAKFVLHPATDNGTAGTPNTVYKDRVTSQDNRFWGWTGTLDYELPKLPILGETSLKSISSYQVFDIASNPDRDASDLDVFSGPGARETDQQYQELQWSGGTAGELLNWKLSLMYIREKSDSVFAVRVITGATEILNIAQNVENINYGAALNTDWQLTRDLSIVLGGRYTWDQKHDKLLRDNSRSSSEQFPESFAVCTGGSADLKGRELRPGLEVADGIPDDPVPTCRKKFRQLTGGLRAEWSPLERFDWWPTDHTLGYVSIANGFKSGGFAAFRVGDYEPEHIYSFAGGTKNTFWDERVTFNAEGYFYHYRNLQQIVQDGLTLRTDNIDAKIYGWELEWNAEPVGGLRLTGQLSFTNAEITDYVNYDPADTRNATRCLINEVNPSVNLDCKTQDWSGNDLSRAPQWTYTFGAQYDFLLGPYGTLTPRIQYYWQDDTWYRSFNRTAGNTGPNSPLNALVPVGGGDAFVNDLQKAYHHTDVKLRWTSPGERWAFEAFVLNLEDDEVYQNVFVGSALLGNPGFAWYGPPRTYGFRVEMRYN